MPRSTVSPGRPTTRRGIYEKARCALGESDPAAAGALPRLTLPCPRGERGLRALDDLEDRLAEAGSTEASADLSSTDLLLRLAPKVARLLERYLDHPEQAKRSRSWRTKQRQGIGRVIAGLIRTGFDPREATLLDIWLATDERSIRDSVEDDLLAEDFGGPSQQCETVPRLVEVLRDSARLASERSPLSAHHAADDEVPFLPQAVRLEFENLYRMTERLYREHRTRNPDKQLRFEASWKRLEREMKTLERRAQTKGAKDKTRIIRVLTYPVAVAIGLPALRCEVLRRRAAYHGRLLRGSEGSRATAAARREYGKWLIRYLVTAILLSDGLRIKNYTGARLGTHIVPHVRGEDGRWDRVETHFRGYDHPSVSLKIRERGGKAVLDHVAPVRGTRHMAVDPLDHLPAAVPHLAAHRLGRDWVPRPVDALEAGGAEAVSEEQRPHPPLRHPDPRAGGIERPPEVGDHRLRLRLAPRKEEPGPRPPARLEVRPED